MMSEILFMLRKKESEYPSACVGRSVEVDGDAYGKQIYFQMGGSKFSVQWVAQTRPNISVSGPSIGCYP